MNIKTITTVDGVNVVDFGSAASRFYWIENLGSTTVYVSGNENIVPDGDNVKVLSAGCGTMIENLGGKVYILGAGKFQITNQGDKFPPFRNAPVADGGVMASGNPVQIDGLQEGVPFSEMIVSGKNLLTYPFNATTKTVNGITFTDNGDGTITVNGTATANATFRIDKDFGFEKEGNYFLSGCPSGGGLNSFYINWYQNHTGVTTKNYNDYGSGIIIPYQHIFSENNSLAIAIIAGTTVNNLVFHPQLELGDTATEYEPPITGRGLTVNVSGKNLIPYPYNRASGTYNGIELIVHDDGRFDMSGTATASFAILVFANGGNPIYLSGGQTYTISCNTPYDFSKFNISARIYHTDGSYTPIIKFPTTFVAQEGEYLTCTLWIDSDVSVSAKNVELQLEYGDTATAYEPYHGSTTTITPDSNPYIVPNDMRQQDGYNVVSVSEGELSVVGVRKNAAVKKIWDKIDELTTAIIVSNGETIE